MSTNREQAEKYLTSRDYKMKIIKDDGLYRSLEFKHNNSTNGYFLITTWPGYLCISGDMGSFLFSRINNMIDFFAGDGINPSYWSEKVMAESIFGGGVESFSIDEFIENMNDLKSRAEENEIDEEDIKEAFENLEYVGDEYDAVAFVRDFSLKGFDAADIHWPERHTFHYLFACYAINFACNEYLKQKAITA